MLTITFRGPTNTRGARMECRGAQGKVQVPWDHSVDPRPNAEAAVRAYLDKHAYRGVWVVAPAAEHLPCGWVAVRVGGPDGLKGPVVLPAACVVPAPGVKL